MTDALTIETPDGAFRCYVAAPGRTPAAAVVVIQEIFGVNQVVRDICDRLADDGYLALAPDLFWRIAPGIDITDQSDEEMARAFELYNAFDVDKGVDDIAATIDAVRDDPRCNGKVGAVGYCLGGLLAFLTATRTDADVSVAYYGVGIDGHLGEIEKLANPVMLHVAEDDEFVPKPAQERIIAALKNDQHVQVHAYPGRQHAFARVGGAHYHASDAELANGRTGAFLKTALGAGQ